MAGNPSDITNVLNEALGALNKLSNSQLDSVQKINQAHEQASERSKKLSRVIQNSIAQLDLFSSIQEKNEKKKNNPIDNILKTTTDLLKKAVVPKTTEKKKPTKPKDYVSTVKIENSNITVRGNLVMNSKTIPKILGIGQEKKSQSLENFDVKEQDPILLEEVSLLKSIESKLGSPGGSGGGLFDSLFGGLGNMLKILAGGAEAEVGGGLLAGMFGLSKFGKLKNLLAPLKGIKNSLPKLASAGKFLKNPKLLIPALILGAGAAIWGGVKAYDAGVFSKPLDQIGNPDELNAEQREKGGSVYSGKPYIVGEKGPELFTPRESGRIVPNDKLGMGHQDSFSEIVDLFKDYNKSSNKVFDYFTDKVNKVFEFLSPSNILDMIKKFIGKAGDVAKGVLHTAINVGTQTVNKVSNFIGMGDLIAPTQEQNTNIVSVNSPAVASAPQEQTPPRSHRIGSYSIPSDGPSTVHKNEMIIPAAQAELVRTAAKLNNQQMSIPSTPEVNQAPQLPKEFWMNEFVTKFANSIKTKKNSERVKEYSIGNIFGTP